MYLMVCKIGQLPFTLPINNVLGAAVVIILWWHFIDAVEVKTQLKTVHIKTVRMEHVDKASV